MSATILATGTLATKRRTVAGILAQFGVADVPERELLRILRSAGLPARAMTDQDFPISVDRELVVLSVMLGHMAADPRSPARYVIETYSDAGINLYGILGLTMQHAATALEALQVMLAYPELCWGHSRIIIEESDTEVVVRFAMGAPVPDGIDADDLCEYCVTLDLVSITRMLRDVLGDAVLPTAISLPFDDPGPAFDARRHLPCPVTFGAQAAEIHYPLEFPGAVPVHAGRLAFQRYEKIARSFAHMLADDAGSAEQTSRLLWAYTPPPSREQLADMLGIGVRTLARRLRSEGTSYNALLRQVQTERATNFLRQTATPIAEIAERMGYSDPAAFTRAFQSWTGMAPSRWRAERRGGDG
ncbi:MAG TPA: helix-turn-helix domain-containing protein [Pseudomonadales bacterium]|nr:helix-turn-helix domain-containing protein [Pseudomonadales bacterium]